MTARWRAAAGLAASLLLAGCIAEDVKRAQPRPLLTAAARLSPDSEPIALARIMSTVPRGTQVGSYWFGHGCIPPPDATIVTWKAEGDLDLRGFDRRFYDALSPLGFKVASDPHRMFGEADELAKARYLIGAQITDIQYSLCYHSGPFRINIYGPRGDSYVKINWQVYSAAERRIVHEAETEGNGHTEVGSNDGIVVLLQQAFQEAASRFGRDAKLRAIVSGSDPDVKTASAARAVTEAAVTVPRFATFRTPVNTRLNDVRNSAVSIITSVGAGSGFFISDDGYILTNQHVVGDAGTVNVRLLSGVELTGRVLSRHALRDVALVKVGLQRTRPLPLRLEPMNVGDEVYALGSPLGPALAGSVTRGIVSALRRDFRGGTEVGLIQSDAAIQRGNSGGPLLDSSGNVAGIAVEGWGRDNTGLNFFVPIGEALEYLNIELGASRDIRF